MIQTRGESLTLCQEMIFETALNNGVFPDDWTKCIILPDHKKDLKNMLKNYCALRLVPVFKMIKFTSMLEFFIDHELFTVCQSSFLPGDSCISQLLSILHEIQKLFDESPPIDVKGAFLDIFWHKRLAYKRKLYEISENLKFIENYLTDCKQRVSSHWSDLFLGESSFWSFPRISPWSAPFLHIY